MVDVRKVECLRNLTNRIILVGEQEELGTLNAVMLEELHGTLAAVFLEQASKITFADTALRGDLGKAEAAVALQQLNSRTNAVIAVFCGEALLLLTNDCQELVDDRLGIGQANDVFFKFLCQIVKIHRKGGAYVVDANDGGEGGDDVLTVGVGQLKMDNNGILPIPVGVEKLHAVAASFWHIGELILAHVDHLLVRSGDFCVAVFSSSIFCFLF